MTLIEPHTYARPLGAASLDARPLPLPMGASRPAMGFPSPAEDFEDDAIDLNELLVRNPSASYLYRAEGWSMLHAGICDGDVLVVDRSVTPQDGDIVLAVWDGQMVCKVLKVTPDHLELHSRNPHCPNIVLTPETEVEVFAVTGVARQIQRKSGRRVRPG
jgi:DNA polymerase V